MIVQEQSFEFVSRIMGEKEVGNNSNGEIEEGGDKDGKEARKERIGGRITGGGKV